MRRFLAVTTLAVCMCTACGATIAAQEFPLPDHPRFTFQSVPESLGLSTTTVTSLVQDRDGFLWVGTQTGLYRYDGLTVTRFGEDVWFRSSYVTQLLISPRGELWVATHIGIWRYSGGNLVELTMPPTAKFSRNGRQVFAVDSENQVFIATENGILRVNADAPHGAELIVTNATVAAICRAPDDSIIAAWQDNVGRIEHGGHTLSAFPEKLTDEMYALLTDAGGDIWARTEKHFSRWDAAAKHWIPEDNKLPSANDFGYPTVDRDGEILLPTDDGLYRRVNGKWEVTNLVQGMESNAVSAALEDRDGSIWVGYVGAGIDRWPGRKEWVGWSTSEGLPDGVVWAVIRDNQKRLWVGTNNGLSMWNPETHHWRVWKDRDGLAVGAIYKLAIAGDDSLWALSTSGGLTRIDLKTLKLEPIKLHSTGDNGYLGLASAPDGTVWVSGRGYVGRFGTWPHQQELTVLDAPKVAMYALSQMSISTDGTLWTVGHTGVMRFDGKAWKHIGPEDGLRMKAVETVWAASKNDAWVTYMEARGVTKIHIDDNGQVELRHIGTSNGLPSNLLNLVSGDREGNIWLGGDHGISVIRKNGIMTNYDRDSGLLWNDVSGGGFFEDTDGGIFVGTSRGLSYRRAGAGVPEKQVPNTILTSATFAGKESLQEKEPRVEHKNGTFAAQFAAPVFQNASDLRCRYQLHGLEKDTVETKLREVRYTALPAGSYTFQVSCGSLASGWGEPAKYSFTVMSPWWLRWWVLAFAGFLTICFLRWAVVIRTRALEKDRQRLEAAVKERSAELAAANRRLEELSLTDPLTGAQNRRFFDLMVPRQTQQALRAYQTVGVAHPPRDRDVILFFVDLDLFKKVNDTFGHAVGDRALVEVVHRLNSVVRQVDSLVRWGGEEFVIISGGNNRETAQQMAQRILDAVGSKPFDLGEAKEHQLTCSVGWAPYPWLTTRPAEVTIEQVIIFADRGLYLAKSEGRNRAVGVFPASEEITPSATGVDSTDLRFVLDLGPGAVAAPASAKKEQVVR